MKSGYSRLLEQITKLLLTALGACHRVALVRKADARRILF